MKHIQKVVIVISLSLVIMAFGALQYRRALLAINQNNLEQEKSVSAPVVIESQASFYNDSKFRQAILLASSTKAQQNITGIIVPHHLLATDYIAPSFKRASGRPIKLVVVVGPNHDDFGGRVSSIVASWSTVFGAVNSSPELTYKFMNDVKSYAGKDAFVDEHSVGAMMPFIKYNFPEASVLPIILSSRASQEEVEKIGDWLSVNLPADSLVVFSIDFSHYLSIQQARERDRETEALILGSQVNRILKLDSQNLDSPATLVTALVWAKKLELNTNIILKGNSADFANEIKPRETTSYFVIDFMENNQDK